MKHQELISPLKILQAKMLNIGPRGVLYHCSYSYPSHRTNIPVLPFCDFPLSGKLRLPAKYPKELKTIADHLLKRRFDLKLSQPQVAKMIGVSTDTITYWENGRFVPKVMFAPKLIGFLGYDPFQIDTGTLGGKVKHYRYQKGLSQKRFAKLLGVDPSTIKAWEENEFEPEAENSKKLAGYLETVL